MILAQLILIAQLCNHPVHIQQIPPCAGGIAPGNPCIWQWPNMYLYQVGVQDEIARPAYVYIPNFQDRPVFDDREVFWLLEGWRINGCSLTDTAKVESGVLMNCDIWSLHSHGSTKDSR